MAVGLFGEPSTLRELADTANPLLPDFVEAVLEDKHARIPQIMLADDFQSALLVETAMQVNRRVFDRALRLRLGSMQSRARVRTDELRV